MFLVIIMGATDKRAPQGFAPIAIGLGLTLIHLISIPVTNTSVNPARSTGVALFVGGWAVAQLWLFWLAPIAGGVLGALVYRLIGGGKRWKIRQPDGPYGQNQGSGEGTAGYYPLTIEVTCNLLRGTSFLPLKVNAYSRKPIP